MSCNKETYHVVSVCNEREGIGMKMEVIKWEMEAEMNR